MVTAPKFKLVISNTEDFLTEDLSLLPSGYYWCAVSSSQPMFTTSSTPGYGWLPISSNSEKYIIQNNLLRMGLRTFHGTPDVQMVRSDSNVLTPLHSGLSETPGFVEINLTPGNMVVTCHTFSENHPDETNSNIQQINYDDVVSDETALKARELAYLLTLEPIEDAYDHPAEKLVEDSLKSSQFDPTHWLYKSYFENINRKSLLSGAILRLLSRLPRSLVGRWGLVVAINGLAHRDIEVREAAIRALERWGGHEAFVALKAHGDAEPMPWLAAYIRQVIKDLED